MPQLPDDMSDDLAAMMANAMQPQEPVRRATAKVGRNDDCPCGSGKKYKRCCGRGE